MFTAGHRLLSKSLRGCRRPEAKSLRSSNSGSSRSVFEHIIEDFFFSLRMSSAFEA